MHLRVDSRPSGDIPYGALLMASLTALPVGAWLIERGWVHFGTCGMKRIAALPCMMCGSTRATIHLLRGDLLEALSFQPMTIVAYGAILVWGTISLVAFAADRRIRIDFSETESLVFKASLLTIPIVNWIYLIASGV